MSAGSKIELDLEMLSILRTAVGEPIAQVSDDRLQRIVNHCGDVDLAADALTMVPRATWAQAIIDAA